MQPGCSGPSQIAPRPPSSSNRTSNTAGPPPPSPHPKTSDTRSVAAAFPMLQSAARRNRTRRQLSCPLAPTVVIDVKGDLPNLLLAFPDFEAKRLEPWIERDEGMSDEAVAARALDLAEKRRK